MLGTPWQSVQWLGLWAFTAGGTGFDPWLGNQDPTSHVVWPKKKKKCVYYIYIHFYKI